MHKLLPAAYYARPVIELALTCQSQEDLSCDTQGRDTDNVDQEILAAKQFPTILSSNGHFEVTNIDKTSSQNCLPSSPPTRTLGGLTRATHYRTDRPYCSQSSRNGADGEPSRREAAVLLKLTHIMTEGKASMVDVSDKKTSAREATATATVNLGVQLYDLIVEEGMLKGGFLTVVQLAGIMGAKRTSDLIPLCHNIPIDKVQLDIQLSAEESSIQITAVVKTTSKTGVEMEALTAVAIAALTVYDMCKAVSHNIQITDVKLLTKSGGKSDFKRQQ